jgi:CDP-diacylglycerol---serine O-phosphatidyltransferase
MKLFTLPNFLTLGNLFCGCLGIVFLFQSEYSLAGTMIFIALVFDFFDGFVARLLKINSEIGKQLDSLADVVTFGVLPALMIYRYLDSNTDINPYLKYCSLLLAGFSALRLAKFNIDTRQSDSFIGLPTPANGMVVATFPFLIDSDSVLKQYVENPYFLIAYVLVFSYLLVMEVPLFALKFKDFSWQTNKIKFIFLIISALMLLLLQITAVPLIVVLYILISLMVHFKVVIF